jgi:hypothetical protein
LARQNLTISKPPTGREKSVEKNENAVEPGAEIRQFDDVPLIYTTYGGAKRQSSISTTVVPMAAYGARF